MTQVKRSIKIAFPGGTAPQEIQSDATTWGDLKKELKNELQQSFSNQKVRDYNTNHHYSDANAVLPEGDIKLLVSTDKNKSGMGVTKGNYHKVNFAELRTFAKKTLGKAPNGKQACIDALNKHYSKDAVADIKAAPKKAASKATAKETSSPGSKSTSKARAKGGSVEARLTALEEKWDKYFGDDDDAGFMAASKNLQ